MANIGSSDCGEQDVKIALFGPQGTHWTQESLADLQSALVQGAELHFLTSTLVQLPLLWSRIEQELGVSDFAGEGRLKELRDFALGQSIPDPQHLSNTHQASLTVLSHALDLVRRADGLSKNDALLKFQAAQGFCIGFLSAVALASSSDWTEFEHNASKAVSLAACIGLIIDAENASHAVSERATSMSALWKTAADRAFLEASLDLFPKAYISCLTDERAVTITLPSRNLNAFRSRLREAKIATVIIGLDGCYHHSRNNRAAQALKRLCAANDELALPSADKLRFSLRSTADTDLITTGALHDVAIDVILCRRAHWSETVKVTADKFPHGSVKFVQLGRESCIPRSVLFRDIRLTNAVSAHNDARSHASGIEEIAVVGMACRFPQAHSVEEFWELLSSGKTSLGKLPIERFNPADISREPKLANYWGNFLSQPDAFDHRFFGISGREAKSMDPQQRLTLNVAYEAMESFGYFNLPPKKREVDVGCYIGVASADYEDNVASENANAFAATGTLRAFVSGRTSHFFGWTGPSVTFDTACSSSATAIHTACKALLAGECSLALAGGVSVISSPNLYQNLAAAGFLSPHGSSRAFDVDASGYCRGEGAGLLVLKPLAKAVSDNDAIVGVISASAINQGSNCSPITVPDAQSQSLLYRRVLFIGQIEPREVTYVEAHGTGTPVGDPIEYESVRSALTGPWRNKELFLGSVKDNIGHAEAASGAAGVIKTLLMLQYKTIPKQANFTSLNPRINFSSSDRITVPQVTQPWTSQKHVALVNNYGAAGSNVTIAIRAHSDALEHPKDLRSQLLDVSSSQLYPILLSAKSKRSLQLYMEALKSYTLRAEASFGDIAYNIARRQNSVFDNRNAFTAPDSESFLSILDTFKADAEGSVKVTHKRPVILVFGGQNGCNVTVSRELYESCDILKHHLDECDAVCQTLGLPSILPGIFEAGAIEDLVSLHCMLLSLQVSCAKCWIDSGLEVEAMIGHSFGQLTALYVADSLSLEDAFRLISSRARLIRDSWGPEHGAMLSVECDRDEVDAVVNQVNSTSGFHLDIACYNGSRSFVLSGDSSSIAKAEEECRSFKTIRLRNTHAYHSYLADGILHDLKSVAESISIRQPRIHVETCSRDGVWSQFTAENVVQHTRQAVYFFDAVKRIAARFPSAVWLEAGSASSIIAMTRRIVRKPSRSDTFITTDMANGDAAANLASATCELWKAGCATQYWLFHSRSHQRYKSLNLPPYQFDESRHWIEYKPNSSHPPTAIAQHLPAAEPNLVERINGSGAVGGSLFLVNISNVVFDLAVRGHAVTGQSLCPASLYIELAAQCAIALSGAAGETLTSPHVENLIMSAPLGADSSPKVFLRLHDSAERSWDFTIFSRPAESGGLDDTGVEHAKGLISLIPAGDVVAEKRLKLLTRFARSFRTDELLNSPAATGISGMMVYKLFSNVVEYANYYRGVKRLSALSNEVVGTVEVPTERPFRVDRVLCDPISLDNFLQVAGIHVNCLSNRKDDEVFMCTTVEEVIVPTTFMTKPDSCTWTVYSRFETLSKGRLSNDIFVYDSSSNDLVLVILGANFRSVPFKSLARTLDRVNATTGTARDMGDGSHQGDLVRSTSFSTLPDDYYEQESTLCPSLSASSTKEHSPNGQQTTGALEEPAKSSNSLHLVRHMLSNVLEIPMEEINPDSKLDDLGIDSLLVTELLTEVQTRFNVRITQAQVQDCDDVISLCRCIHSHERSVEEFSKSPDRMDKPVNGFQKSSDEPHINDAEHEEHNAVDLANLSRDCFVRAKTSYDEHAKAASFANFFSKGFISQSELVVQYVVVAFASLGCALQGQKPGDEVGIIQYVPKHKKLVAQLYMILSDAGLIQKDDGHTFRRTAKPVSSVPIGVLQSAMLEQFPQHSSESKLLHATGSRLADCLSGAADPLALIFGDATARALLEDVYTNAPMFQTGVLVLSQYLSSTLEHIGTSRELKILEIGAGTGGTTKPLVKKIAAFGTKCKLSYTFTDVSRSLVTAARRKFAKYSFMNFEVLDIEKCPEPQFTGAYDIIISTNCIHATRDLVQSATNIRKMLRTDGVLCLIELTRNLFWFDLVFGLLEGWWLFSDGREHVLADERRWERCLRAAGFAWVDWSGSPSKESELLRVITASPSNVVPYTNTTANSGGLQTKIINDTKETVVFKKVGNLDLCADIYYPTEVVAPGKSRPVALMIHGGGHLMLSRNDVRPEQTLTLLNSGFIPISIDYRLCPETTLPEGPMTDVVDALVWIRTVLPKLVLSRTDIRVDGERVVSVGWSTGGHLAMSLAWTSVTKGIRTPEAILAFYCPLDYEDPFWTKPNIPAGSEALTTTTRDQVSSSSAFDYDIWAALSDSPIVSYNIPPAKRALGGWLAPSDTRSRLVLYMNHCGRTLHVLLNGLDKRSRTEPPMPTAAAVAAVSPLAQIRQGKHTTPTFIIHPRQDDLIPWQQAQQTWDVLRAQGIDSELRIVEDVPHLFDLYRAYKGNERARMAVKQGYEFLCRYAGTPYHD